MSKFIYFWIPTSINTIAIYALQLYGFKWAWEKKTTIRQTKNQIDEQKNKIAKQKKRTSVETFWIFSVFKSRIKCKREKKTTHEKLFSEINAIERKKWMRKQKKAFEYLDDGFIVVNDKPLKCLLVWRKSVNEIKIEIVQHFDEMVLLFKKSGSLLLLSNGFFRH